MARRAQSSRSSATRRSLERAFKKSSKSANTFGRSMEKTQTKTKRAFGGIGRMATFAAGAIGTAGLIGVARSAFAEFSEAQKVAAQTAAALKSTGGAANVTAKEIDELADSMLKKTGIDDEAIKTSENMLLTFTRIRNEVGENNRIFDRATESVADLATAMNQGAVPSADQMQRASIQLGKALNDPIKGVGALARVGIQFTKRQKDQIKTLVESGKTMEAQKVILAELNKEVGGRAAAAGKTFSGQWRILIETLNNLTGVLAAKLMPTIQRYLEMAVRWVSNSQNQKKVIDAVTAAGQALKTALDTLVGAFKILSRIVGGNKNAIIAPGRRLRHLQGRADRVHGHEPGLELRPARPADERRQDGQPGHGRVVPRQGGPGRRGRRSPASRSLR